MADLTMYSHVYCMGRLVSGKARIDLRPALAVEPRSPIQFYSSLAPAPLVWTALVQDLGTRTSDLKVAFLDLCPSRTIARSPPLLASRPGPTASQVRHTKKIQGILT